MNERNLEELDPYIFVGAAQIYSHLHVVVVDFDIDR